MCTKYFDALKFDPRYRSALATKEEQLQDTYDKNQEIISKHSHTTMLQKFITVLQSRKQESIVEGFKEATERQNEQTNDVFRVTALMFRLVFAEVTLNIPLASHPKLVDLMQQNGADMGYHHYDRRSTQRIVDFISNSMHRELLKTLNENSPDVSIILDGSTDPRQNHYLIVFLQAVEEYKPVVYFYRLIPLSMDETAEGLLKTLQESFEEDRLTKFMKEHLIGYAADGAAVMMGKHNGLAKKLSDFIGRPLLANHCLAHRIHLAIKRAFKEFTFIYGMETMLNKLYSFYYSHGHKRKAHLHQFSEGKVLELNYIFETRWISSELSAIKRVITNYPILQPRVEKHSLQGILCSQTIFFYREATHSTRPIFFHL